MRFRRWKFRGRQKMMRWRKRGGVWFLGFAVLFAILFQIIWMLEAKLEPTLINIARTEVKQLATEAVLEATRSQVEMGEDLNGIMTVEKGEDGMFFIRTDKEVQAKVYAATLESLHQELHKLKRKDLGITLGQALQSNILSGYGPEIPLEIWPKAAPQVNLRPKMESAGVNNIMVTLMMEIHTEMSVVVPFSTKPIAVETEIPLGYEVVGGKVPRFYYYNDMGGEIKRGDISEESSKGRKGSSHSQPMPVLPPIEAD